MSQYLEIIQKIHSSPFRFVLVSSGGGTNAISEILKVAGASESVLEAYVPYAKESLDYYLLKQPDHYCSLDTTLSMAAKAYSAAKKIAPGTNPKNLLGVAVTASLATNYSKKGEHKFFIAIQTYKYSSSFSYSFVKGELTREEEEQVVTDHIIKVIAQSCEVQNHKISENSSLKIKTVEAEKNWVKLVDSKIDFVSSSNRIPELIFPGSFNPFHSGHNSMSELAEKKTGLGLAYEICIQNADKPPLSYHEIEKTLNQFNHGHEWVLTKAGKFTDKAALFPNSVFIIGADTLTRILDEKFYLNRQDMLNQLDLFNSHNINFLVFGRKIKNNFIDLDSVTIPEHIDKRFSGFGEEIFRDDISSTLIRKEQE
ncbi:cytidylyltransferase [Gammaproteobacteria bacterium]|jgi:nicotinic acid mononucleotide adenylyltransferase|nr:cytidylyltransferase [Gammaproteobacteria bacterium]|tara:strand:+ start:334 stop:1440 length:1107 start_codon:yes stop_codon:yes gene_type:complete